MKKYNMIKTLILGLLLAAPVFGQAQSVEDRLDSLEEKALLNSFSFNGSITNRFMNTTYKATEPGSEARDDSASYWSTKGHLGINSDISDEIKFYTQIGIHTIWNSVPDNFSGSESDVGPTPNTLFDNQPSKGILLYWKRFYIDYKYTDWLTMSIGRLPTTKGNPSNFKDGVARQGTYPQLAYNAMFDGIGLTFTITEELKARLLMTPFQYHSMGSLSDQPKIDPSGADAPRAVNFGAAQFDYTKNNVGWASSFNAVLQKTMGGKFKMPSYFIAPVGATPAASLWYQIDWTTLYLEATALMNSNLDVALTAYNTDTSVYAGTVDNEFSSKNQTSFHLALKYNFGESHVGLEYMNKGDFSSYFDSGSEWETGLYSGSGTGLHVYYTIRKNGNTAYRVGYFANERTKQSIFTGADPADSDLETKTTYANMRVDF